MFYPSSFPQDKKKLLIDMFQYLSKQKIEDRNSLEVNIRGYLKEKKIKDFYPKNFGIYISFIFATF